MATNPTNSTTVNIRNLPTSQLAVDSDDFILQTNNGTQIISFRDLNVVKTDINGNATVTGTLTGTNAIFTGSLTTPSISASQFTTTGGRTGFTPPFPTHDYYDSFTIVNGLVVSATRAISDFTGNPIYTSLYTQLTAASASLTTKSTYKNIFDYTAQVNIPLGATASSTINWTGLPGFTNEVNSRLNASSFSIMPGNGSSLAFALSTVPFITNISGTPGATTGSIAFILNAGMLVPASSNFGVRVLITY
jgi:hypothetical protein